MADDLNKPLGLKPPRQKRGGFRMTAATGIGIAAVALVTAGTAIWALRPADVGPTATTPIKVPPAPAASAPAPERTASIAPASQGLVEAKPTGSLSGVGGVVISDPSAAPAMRLASAPADGLVEQSPYGPLPRVAADGRRPLDIYARPTDASQNDVRIAIVIGGLGIDRDGSERAIELPGAVTLAFAPYGDGLQPIVADARSAGHEVLLQVPLEPFNYPKTDPGPHTLTVSASEEENLDRLHWLLSRMTNYVGVVNYMGGRFTGERDEMASVLGEIGKRGLLYLDDGSSARSRAVEVAGGTPVLRADVVLDADLAPDAIDARLDQLRAIARERGYAIATATAFPATLDRVAEFARTAGDRGVTLVPLSALANSSRS
jgi:polysaccharide deacetylase 2 family uncharacterized protein YibQ